MFKVNNNYARTTPISYIINYVNIIWISLIGQRFWGEKFSQDKNFPKFISAYDFWVQIMESKRFSKYNPKHIRFKFCEAFFRAIAIAINNNCFKQQFVEVIIRPKFVKLKKKKFSQNFLRLKYRLPYYAGSSDYISLVGGSYTNSVCFVLAWKQVNLVRFF